MNPFERNSGGKATTIQLTYEQWQQLMQYLGNIHLVLTQIEVSTRHSQTRTDPHAPTYYAAAAINYAQHPNDPVARMMAFANPPGALYSNKECCTDQLNLPVGPEASISVDAMCHYIFQYMKAKYHVEYLGQIATTKFKDTGVATFLDAFLRPYKYSTGMEVPPVYSEEHKKFYVLSDEDREALSNMTEKECNRAMSYMLDEHKN